MTYIQIYWISILVLFFFSCKKESPTTINGLVTDFKTGLAIEKAVIDYSTYSNQTGEYSGNHEIKTAFDGTFLVTMDYDETFSYFQVNKSNYLPDLNYSGENVSFEKGKENDLEIKLHPLDAVIRVVSNNSLPLNDSLYVQVQSKTLLKVLGLTGSSASKKPSNYPIVAPYLGQNTSDIQFISGEMAYLYWSFSQFGKTDQAAFRDSVFLATGDTAVYNINY